MLFLGISTRRFALAHTVPDETVHTCAHTAHPHLVRLAQDGVKGLVEGHLPAQPTQGKGNDVLHAVHRVLLVGGHVQEVQVVLRAHEPHMIRAAHVSEARSWAACTTLSPELLAAQAHCSRRAKQARRSLAYNVLQPPCLQR